MLHFNKYNPVLPAVVNSTVYDLLNADEQVDNSKLIGHNKAAILRTLAETQTDTAIAYYEGQGDSGGFVNIDFCPNSTEPLEQKVKVVDRLSAYNDESRLWDITLVEQEVTVAQALEQTTYMLIHVSGHSGYENNDGGNGVITFNVATGEVTHDHYDNITEQDHSVNRY